MCVQKRHRLPWLIKFFFHSVIFFSFFNFLNLRTKQGKQRVMSWTDGKELPGNKATVLLWPYKNQKMLAYLDPLQVL